MDEAVFVDEFREAPKAPGRIHFVADVEVGVALCVLYARADDETPASFWVRVYEGDGRVCLSGVPIEPTDAEHAAFFRMHPETKRLQQPARGVRVTGAGTLRVVK